MALDGRSYQNGCFGHGPSIPLHRSGILVGPYSIQLSGKVIRNDGVDLSSGFAGTSPVAGSRKVEPNYINHPSVDRAKIPGA